MIINLIVWILFGALVGWIASMIMGTNTEQGGVANVLLGILGAIVGGFLSRLFGGGGITGFNVMSFFVALIGAMILVGLYKMLAGSSRHNL